MKKLARLSAAEPVIHGVLKLTFLDGFVGVVDLRPVIAQGKVFAWLQDAAHFADLRLEEFGHAIHWTDETGYEIALSATSLRRDCERQAEIHRLMVG